MSDALAVFLHDTYLGEVTPLDHGRRRDTSRVRFSWDSGYSPGTVTLTESFTSIPGRDPNSALVSNFFGGYAPDGNHREAMAAARAIDPGDLFALLREFGGSIGGALTFRTPDEPSNWVPHYTPIDDAVVAQRLKQAVEHHDLGIQEDAAQAMGLDWQNSDAKFHDPLWPTNPTRPNARKIAEITGSLPNAVAETESWLRQLVFHVLIGDNDAHAKNVGFVHENNATRLSELYDAVPNLYQDGRISWDMAMPIDGDFDHRKVSAESIVREAASWAVLQPRSAESVISATVRSFREAQASVTPPSGVDPLVVDRLNWNARRLAEGNQISAPKQGT